MDGEQPREAGGEEVKILEDGENAEIDRDRERAPAPGETAFSRGLGQLLCDEEVDYGGEGNEEEEPCIPGPVEDVAGHQQEAVLATMGKDAVDPDHHHEEEPEEVAVECQRDGPYV